jgi:predicted secreted protein
MYDFFFILILFLQVVRGCQQVPAGKSLVDNLNGKNHGKLLVEKCTGSIEVQLSDTVVFRFTEVSGRGYSWVPDAPDSLSPVLKAAGVKRYMTEDKDGAEEKVEFYFSAVNKGVTTLKFKYSRPWEKTKPAADSCITLISIK